MLFGVYNLISPGLSTRRQNRSEAILQIPSSSVGMELRLINVTFIRSICALVRFELCLSLLGFLLPKNFKLFGFPIFFILSVQDEGYCRNKRIIHTKLDIYVFISQYYSNINKMYIYNLERTSLKSLKSQLI